MSRTDRDHLRILSICHYVLAALVFFFGAFFALYLVIGFAIVAEAPAQPAPNGPPPEFIGWVFIAFAGVGLFFQWLLAALMIAAGNYLAQQKRRTFCLVVAGFACLFQPLGTVLGIFTIVVLMRPSIRDAFEPASDEADERDEHDTYHSE